MSIRSMNTQGSLLAFLRNVSQHRTDRSDGQLLTQFLDTQCEDSFSLLVRRHGPMVFGVCQRILPRSADAEDAFQATFVVLAKRAAAIRKRDSLASWLYGVALRCSRQLKVHQMNQRERELAIGQEKTQPAKAEATTPELEAVLDEEVQRLPRKYQEPVLLCYFEGLTREEAAQHLGWPLGTVAGRLSRANQMLKKRLVKRGLAAGAVTLATLLEQQATKAALPPTLVKATVTAVRAISASGTVATGVSANVSVLARQVVQQMTLAKWKKTLLGSVILACVIGGAVTGFAMQSVPQPQPQQVTQAEPALQVPPQAQPQQGPKVHRITNKQQSIVVLSDKKMDLQRYFQTNRILIGVWPDREADVYLKANAEETTVGCHYGTINDNLDDQWYVVNAKMSKIKEPVRQMCLAELKRLTKQKNRAHWGLSVVLRQDAKDRQLYHLVGFTTETSVQFFAQRHRELRFLGPGKTDPFKN